MAGYSLRNNFLLPVTVSVTPEKPYTSRAVTAVTLFLNSLREKKESTQRGKEKRDKKADIYKKQVAKSCYGCYGAYQKQYLQGFSGAGSCYKKRYELLRDLLLPPTLDGKQGRRHTAVGAYFSSPRRKTFSRKRGETKCQF